MIYIIAGTHEIFTNFCETYSFRPGKDADRLTGKNMFLVDEMDVVFRTCRYVDDPDWYLIFAELRRRRISYLAKPCQLNCTMGWR
jgi:hypothetical protein